MMSVRRFARLGATALTAALLVGVVAAPAAAKNPTRWVDDNAGGNGGPAACATAAYTSIQAAIDASGKWDHVNVCPGTYPEQLTLDVKGILVQAVPNRQAHLVPPVTLTEVGGVATLVRMTAYAARLAGFRIDIPAGNTTSPVSRGTAAGGSGQGGTLACSPVDVAVLVLGQRSRVLRNVIDVFGTSTYFGSCGYSYGIVVGVHSLPTVLPPPFDLLNVSRVARNTVHNFKAGGVLVEGDAYSARVDHNTITYDHNDIPCFAACVRSQNSVGASVNNAFIQSFGIGVEDDAVALVEHNTLSSTYNAEGIESPGNYLEWAITLAAPNDATVVRNNDIDSVRTGIYTVANLIGPEIVAAGFGDGGATIFKNTIHDSDTGVELRGSGTELYDNTATLNNNGIAAFGLDNDIHDNDFRNSVVQDCWDFSPAGSGTAGTSNQWTNNHGNTETPSGICDADPN